MEYKAPLRDIRFAYYELFDGASLAELPGYEEATPDLVESVLEEMGKIAGEVLQPLNSTGDEEGCVYQKAENGGLPHVKVPEGFKGAYDLLARRRLDRPLLPAGVRRHGDAPHGEHDGQRAAVRVQPVVRHVHRPHQRRLLGARPPRHRRAQAEVRAEAHRGLLGRHHVPDRAPGGDGPGAGADDGGAPTRWGRGGDGYKINGNKIFVSAGEHDLTENIVHLILARLPDAPEGIKGISMFVVPKLREDENGQLVPNGVTCSSIEHKMGIKGSSTCSINFDDSIGYLVGEPNKGMRAMFTMMNAARLHVGVQGLALAEASYQGAVDFARERLQGRALTGAKYPDQEADPIIVHPDVRRMLLSMRAFTEGARALTAWAALEIDRSEVAADPDRRTEGDDLASLLTPVIKAFQTDLGYEMANLGMQVCGGYGYTHEYGMEQLVRDARITQIYEGTNGIQALDLVGRKLGAHFGRYLRRFFHPVSEFLEAESGNEALAEYLAPTAKAFERLQRATGWLAQAGMQNPDEAGAAASDYLHLFGYTAFAYLWTRMAKVAQEKLEAGATGEDKAFYEAKLRTARFYMQRMLPKSGALFATLMAGAKPMMDFPDEAF